MSPMDGPVDYTLFQLFILNALDSAIIGTLGIVAAVWLANPARRKKTHARLLREFDYFVAATVGLWIFSAGGAVLGW